MNTADDPRWARILARDKSADGRLWYSVSTTGVYCRPSCPSRHALPQNVQLHDSLESARATGCRPCKRCRPDTLSPAAGAAGDEIRFAIGQTSLGAVLVASSATGIASIALGDDPAALVRALADRFPQARPAAAEDESLIAKVVAFVDTPGGTLDLPCDVRGTAFQRRVWQALRSIPAGTKVTYTELARRIGRPNAVRAVASACAANALAVAIPCHRVVRTDGSLSGYAWGVERKRVLLEREGAMLHAT